MITKEAFLNLASARWAELEQLDQEKDFYEYERRFERIMFDLSREVLESKISTLCNDRRKKTKFAPDSASLK
jgi:hypothetical protein